MLTAQDFINVEFDFQAPCESDFQALKRLFQQLFYTHAPGLDLGELASAVIARGQQDGVGTVVKVDDNEVVRDPYAVVSGLHIFSGAPGAAAQLVYGYLQKQLRHGSSPKALVDLLERSKEDAPVLFFVHERMVNMPPLVAPPLYRMAFDELDEFRQETNGKKPTHVVFFSRAFSADAFSDDEDNEPTGLAGARKRKANAGAHPAERAADGRDTAHKQAKKSAQGTGRSSGTDALIPFHPEDDLIDEFASCSHTFRFPPPQDAVEGYEASMFGRIVAVPFDKVPAMLDRIQAKWPAPL